MTTWTPFNPSRCGPGRDPTQMSMSTHNAFLQRQSQRPTTAPHSRLHRLQQHQQQRQQQPHHQQQQRQQRPRSQGGQGPWFSGTGTAPPYYDISITRDMDMDIMDMDMDMDMDRDMDMNMTQHQQTDMFHEPAHARPATAHPHPGYIPRGTHSEPPYLIQNRNSDPPYAIPSQSQNQSQNQNRRRSVPTAPPGYRPQVRPGFHPSAPLFSGSPDELHYLFPPDTLPQLFDCEEQEYFDFDFNSSNNNSNNGSGGGNGNNSFPAFRDLRAQSKFAKGLTLFPELSLDAHKRVYLMGNDIMECFRVRLERFFRGLLLDSVAGCVAAFTKKNRTGQRWLMVFKEEVSRTVVKFNRLLTHSLLVRLVSSTAIEIEAAKSIFGPPTEMCVINFNTGDECTRFNRILHESQTTAWNHREVTQEQRMKMMFSSRMNMAMADMLMEEAHSRPGRSMMTSGTMPMPMPMPIPTQIPASARSPLSVKNSDPFDILARTPSSARSNSLSAFSPLTENALARKLADLDNDWRRRAFESVTDSDSGSFPASLRLTRRPQKINPVRKSSSTVSLSLQAALASLSMSNKSIKTAESVESVPVHTHRMDGSGDQPPTSDKNQDQTNLKNEDQEQDQKDQDQDQKGDKDEANAETQTPTLPEEIELEIPKVSLWVRVDAEFEEVAKGTLQLIDHKDAALNEVRLLSEVSEEGKSKELVQQFIFKWNKAHRVLKDTDTSACIWDGAASFAAEPDAVPERRHFMARFPEKEAEEFADAFNRAVEKARNPAIRQRHISWYLQQKRDYKAADANDNGDNVNANPTPAA